MEILFIWEPLTECDSDFFELSGLGNVGLSQGHMAGAPTTSDLSQRDAGQCSPAMCP